MRSARIFDDAVTINLIALAGALLLVGSVAFAAAAPSAAPAIAKKDAEAKGYMFLATRDEIVSKAKQEGKVRVLASISDYILKDLTAGFRKKYPFIEIRADEIRGADAYLRFLQEVKAGLTKGLDVNDLFADVYNEYHQHQKKIDILGMAEHGVLGIPRQMIDTSNRNIVAVGSGIQVVVYNKKLTAPEKIPDTWEGFLKPEFSDRKFMLNIRPVDISSLVPVWGLEKALDFARKLAAQKPVWGSGHVAIVSSVLNGEHALGVGVNFDTIIRARDKDKTDSLGYKIIEPLPVRLNEFEGVLNTAENPHAAILWLEFLASPEGQKIFDEKGPYEASVFISGTVQEQAARGKKQSVVDWTHFVKVPDYQKKIVEAYGFPQAK